MVNTARRMTHGGMDCDEAVDKVFYFLMLAEKDGAQTFLDDITGQPLDERILRTALRLEMEYFRDKVVYAKAPRAEATKRIGKQPIGIRWVDVNKGDDEEAN